MRNVLWSLYPTAPICTQDSRYHKPKVQAMVTYKLLCGSSCADVARFDMTDLAFHWVSSQYSYHKSGPKILVECSKHKYITILSLMTGMFIISAYKAPRVFGWSTGTYDSENRSHKSPSSLGRHVKSWSFLTCARGWGGWGGMGVGGWRVGGCVCVCVWEGGGGGGGVKTPPKGYKGVACVRTSILV